MDEKQPVSRQARYDRIATFERKLIPHGQLENAWQAIDDLRGRYNPAGSDPLQARALFIVGESGAGKSTLMDHYFARAKTTEGAFRSTPDGDIRPVVHVEKGSGIGMREFATGLLKALGHPIRRDWNASDIVEQIATLCHGMKVEVILVDEAHHLVNGKGEYGLDATQEFVKSLLNRTATQFVFAGIPTLQKLNLSEQVDRRSVPVIGLHPYDWGDITGRAEFLNLLEEMQANLGCKFDPPLDGPHLSPRMYYATQGRIGLASKFLSEMLKLVESLDDPPRPMHLAKIWHALYRPVEVAPRRSRFRDVPVDRSQTVPVAGNPFLVDDDELERMWDEWMDSLPADPDATTSGSSIEEEEPTPRSEKKGRQKAAAVSTESDVAMAARLVFRPQRGMVEKLDRTLSKSAK